jgi:hypothetical protein
VNFYISTFKSKKLVFVFLEITITILSLVFLFNIIINPFGNSLILIEGLTNKRVTDISTKEKLNLLSDVEFNNFTIGSSYVSRFYAEDLEKMTNEKWISLPIGTSMSSEHYHYIEYITKNYEINNILYMIDMENVFGTSIFRGNTIIKDKIEHNVFDYFTFDTTYKSIKKIKFNLKNSFDNNTSLKKKYFNGWPNKVLTEKQFDNLITVVKPNADKFISIRESKYIDKILLKNKSKIIPVITSFHPYILLMKKKNNYTKYINFILNKFGYVYHINPKYFTETLDFSLYYDNSHTNKEFATKVIKSIFSNSDFYIKINKSNYINIIDKLYILSCKQNFSKYTYSNLIECTK